MTEKIQRNYPDGNIHVVPTDDFKEHEESYSCWCQPSMIEQAPNTGVQVWSHNRAKDQAQ